MLSFILVGCGGFVGAVCRYAISKMKFNINPNFPVATLTVNLVGSLLLGFLYSLNNNYTLVSNSHMLLLGTGVMGSFTTFSTFTLESLRLIKSGKPYYLLYILFSVVCGITLAFIGIALGDFIFLNG